MFLLSMAGVVIAAVVLRDFLADVIAVLAVAAGCLVLAAVIALKVIPMFIPLVQYSLPRQEQTPLRSREIPVTAIRLHPGLPASPKAIEPRQVPSWPARVPAKVIRQEIKP